MSVQAIMTRPVPAVEVDTDIDSVTRALDTLETIAVVDAERRPVGTISRDSLHLALSRSRWHPSRGIPRFAPLPLFTTDVVIDPPVTILENAPIAQAVAAFLRTGADQIIVVDSSGRVAGSLWRSEIARRSTRHAFHGTGVVRESAQHRLF